MKLKNLLALCLVSLSLNGAFASKTNITTDNHDTVEYNGRTYQVIGDMLIPAEKQLNKFDVNKSKWVDGKVYYEFDPAVTQDNRQRFVDAYKVWESVANLEFIERTNQSNYVYVQNDNRNYAIVGMVGGRQILSMNNWHSKYIIVHEIGHSLGMWHEQMRSDRDNYVTINEENIDSTQRYNFTKRSTTDYGEYDFLSIMHYPLTAYTINSQRTIEPLPQFEAIAQFAGQRKYISGGDQFSVATHYGPVTLTFADSVFESYLVSNFDLNSDGVIDSLEASQVTEISTPGNGTITSIQGIEHFRYLTSLDVSDEALTQLPPLPSRVTQLDLSNNQFDNVNFLWSEPPLMNSINVAGNPLDAYACDEILVLSTALDNGTVTYNPLSDGSYLTCDENAKFVLLNGKPREDLRSKGTQTYFIDVPANQTQLKFETSQFNNLDGGLMNVYVAFNRQPTTSDYDYQSSNADNVESVTINNPAQGTWYISLIPIDRSFENVTLLATYSDDQVINEQLLVNGESKINLQAGQSDTLSFYMDVPENADNLSFSIAGGSGDADLYVRFGAEPTMSVYDCRPWKNGNNETCAISNVQAGRYFVNLVGYSAFSGVTLTGNYEAVSAPVGGSLTESGLAGQANSWQYFSVVVPQGMSLLDVKISGGTGDVDLYVRRSLEPTISSYDCRPYRYGNEETCRYNSPVAATYYIGLRGYTNYQGVTLEAIWQ